MKKQNNLEQRTNEIFESVENLSPTTPPSDLADKIRMRIEQEKGKTATLVKPTTPIWRYAAAVAMLLLNLSAFYKVSQTQSGPQTNQAYDMLFQEEFGLSSDSFLH